MKKIVSYLMRVDAFVIALILLYFSFFMMIAGFLMIHRNYLTFSLITDIVLGIYFIAYTIKGETIPNWNAIVSRVLTTSLVLPAVIGAIICHSYITIMFANLPGF